MHRGTWRIQHGTDENGQTGAIETTLTNDALIKTCVNKKENILLIMIESRKNAKVNGGGSATCVSKR